MLFDTPGVTVPDSVMAPPTNGPTKRKRKASDDAPAPPSPAVNLDKLLKQMQKLEKDSGWKGDLGAGGKTGVKAAEKEAQGKRKKEQKKANKKAAGPPPTSGGNMAALGQVDVPAPAPSPAPAKPDQGHRGPPPRAAPQPQSRAPPKPAPANPGSPAPAAAPVVKAPVAAWKPAQKEKPNKNRERAEAARAEAALEVANEPKKVVRHSAPTTDAVDDEAAPVIPQTAMQKSLRAKLAGGKFRMLNEALYTSTGEQAWAAMKEDGAFDDVSTS